MQYHLGDAIKSEPSNVAKKKKLIVKYVIDPCANVCVNLSVVVRLNLKGLGENHQHALRSHSNYPAMCSWVLTHRAGVGAAGNICGFPVQETNLPG